MNSETTTDSRKRNPEPMDETEPKKPGTEQFSKFYILPNELRHHALTYTNQQSLFNYAQCSKVCNSEIQQFNTIAPRMLNLTEESDGILVQFIGQAIDDASKWYKRMGKKEILYSEENIMDDVVKHLEVFLKYNKKGKISTMRIDMKRWPTEILQIERLKEIEAWIVFMYRPMFNDCIEFAKSNYGCLNSLTLKKGEEVDIIPRNFFKCPAIKNIRDLTTTKCEIDDDDFLAYWPNRLEIKCSMSFELIREKVRRFNVMETCDIRLLQITLPDDDNRTFDLDVLFPKELFPRAPHYCKKSLRFGRDKVYLSPDGKSVYVYRHNYE